MVKKFAAWLLRVMVESGAFDRELIMSPYLTVHGLEDRKHLEELEKRVAKLEEAPTKSTSADAQNAASILWAELFGNETQHGGDSV